MERNEAAVRPLGATLAVLGALPGQVRSAVEAGRAVRGGTDTPEVLATLDEFLCATDTLGTTAHQVLGHVPEVAESPPLTAAVPSAASPAPPASRLLSCSRSGSA